MDEPLLSQKTFLVIFVVLLLIGIGVVGYSKFNHSSKDSLPTPSSSDNLSGAPPNQNNLADSSTKPMTKKQYPKLPGELPTAELTNKKAVIQTNKGVIEFEIYPDSIKAASNFVFLANDKFYDGLTFHRVVPNFVIQGGDPEGSGIGGPGYKFADDPVTKPYKRGTVAMANAGPNTNGSQFFIVITDNPPLEPKYSIFGQVLKGQDVAEKIAVGDIIQSVLIEPLK